MALPTIVSDILWNFDILASLSFNETLLVDGDKLGFDKRYLQFARRSITRDSRDAILHAIQKTFTLCEEIIQSYQYVINNETLRAMCDKMGSIPDIVWLQNEQIDTANCIFENLQHLIVRKPGVIKGLTTLSTFERYDSDTSFKIELNRFIEKLEKLIRKCENMRTKMKQIYKTTLLEPVTTIEKLNISSSHNKLVKREERNENDEDEKF